MLMKPEVIAGLRTHFIAGATYSGLLRYILKEHAGEELDAITIQSYLMQAFSISFFCPLRKNTNSRRNDDYYATIDTWLIPEILSTRESWMRSEASNSTEPPWWDNLTITNPEAFPRGKPSWISDSSWQALLPPEQEGLAAAATSCGVLSERLTLMARLAEQLQRKISELETKVANVASEFS